MDPSNQNPPIATTPTDSNTSMDPSNQNPPIEPPRAPSRRSLSSLRRSLELSLCLWVGLSRYLCQLVGLSPRRSSPPPRAPPSQASSQEASPAFQGSGFRSVLFFFVAIAYLILIPSTSSIKSSLSILHQVPEGHVGVYWRGGALLNTISDPGFHLKMPFVTQYEPVQVTLQTDQVKDIPCGTNGGVMINFEKIEVVNRLHKDYVYETLLNYGVQYNHMWIYDKIHHEINKFCSSHSLQQVYIDVFDQIDEKMKDALQCDCTRYAPGIEIISVHVTKPTIPDSIRRTFELLEEEHIKVLIAIEKQKIADKEADTMKRMAISEAEKFASVSEILMGQKEMKKDSARRQQDIENQIYTWLGRRVWQMLKESQICTQLMEGVWQMLISIFH
ncbi:erlin-2-B-like [Eucalyptus grandis]|uniref:erlin-2-B-like n=1 Tax=Eucalyptus grandis TaxID=71139 RepID=UPI00192E97A8|nr:erlin-2-B-like [Eucalyptus grandis]